MRPTGAVFAVLICTTALTSSGVQSGTTVWAQTTTPPPEGAYLLEPKRGIADSSVAGGWRPEDVSPNMPKRLFLIPGSKYVWGEKGWHSAFRTGSRSATGGSVQTISLCHRWAGDFVDGKILLYMTHNGVTQRYIFGFEGPLERIRPPDPLPDELKCEEKHWPRVVISRDALFAAAPGTFAVESVAQAQVGPYRTLSGDFLLALNSGRGSGPADLSIWTCIVRSGYPGLEFDEPGVARQAVFVWPDARFLARLRNGVSYKWTIQASECGTSAQDGATVYGDQGPPGDDEEKIALACVIAGQKFADCKGWWLIRP